MKRNMDVVRRILFQIEDRPNGVIDIIEPIEGIDDGVLHGHVELLVEAGV